MQEMERCPYAARCGGCDYQGMAYELQLKKKQERVTELLGEYCPVHPIVGMEDPCHYRNKVHAVLSRTRRGEIISGIYEERSHRVVPVDTCRIENAAASAIIRTIRELIPSFKLTVFNEDTGIGLLRHVLIRVGETTGQIMVVLVTASVIFPSKNNFVKTLKKMHPEITTVVQNINSRRTSMVLSDRDIVLLGPGYIEDTICGMRFRISPRSFYQVNPRQTEKLYKKAIALADVSGRERVIDAYCGTGTIGLLAAKACGELLGIEFSREAIADAILNARENGVKNARFVCNDAGSYVSRMALEGKKADVLLMDPPRSGSTETFLKAAAELGPERIVYISCNPETQRRDIQSLLEKGYRAEGAWPFDLFPFTEHVECVVLMSRVEEK